MQARGGPFRARLNVAPRIFSDRVVKCSITLPVGIMERYDFQRPMVAACLRSAIKQSWRSPVSEMTYRTLFTSRLAFSR